MQLEIFEVFNDKGKRRYFTYYKESIPPKEQLEAMLRAGYKIKINGTIATKKKLNEFLNELSKEKEIV